MMGAGKSSVGRCLARRSRLARIDTDETVAAKFGISIAEIFSHYGEAKFREVETETLRNLVTKDAAIIVTGGGVVRHQENVDLLKQLGIIVWLDGDEVTLFERASRRGNRPLLQTENPRATFAELLRTRTPLYAKIADIRIDTSSLNQDDAAEMILNKIGNLFSTKQ